MADKHKIKLTRTSVRWVKCPYCGSETKQKCVGVKGELASNHRERINAFLDWRAWKEGRE